MLKLRTIAAICLSVSAGLALPARASADHRRHPSCADADIDCLRASVVQDCRNTALAVRYDIGIEDAAPCERFDLILRVTDCGRTLCDRNGRDTVISIPLTCPTRCHGEATFRSQVVVPLPAHVARHAHKLRVEAKVISARSGRVLDCDDVTVCR